MLNVVFGEFYVQLLFVCVSDNCVQEFLFSDLYRSTFSIILQPYIKEAAVSIATAHWRTSLSLRGSSVLSRLTGFLFVFDRLQATLLSMNRFNVFCLTLANLSQRK